MAKKLLIRTPETSDGTTLLHDENKQIVYKETTVPASALKHFESLNASLPEHLRHEIEEVEVDAAGNVVKPKPAAKAKAKDVE